MKEEKERAEISRRDFLTLCTAAVGATGVGTAAVPFIKALSPTKDIIAAGVKEVDIGDIREGDLKKTIWRKQPVFILRRTEYMIRKTDELDERELKDAASVEERTVRPDIFVSIAICTHLGCVPRFRPQNVEGTDQPGFYCPCHGGKYDTLGRRLGGPPPENLHLLPYLIENDSKIILGTETFSGYGENVRKIKDLPIIS